MTVRRPQSSYNKNGAASLLILKLIWFTGLYVFINKFLMPSYFDFHVSILLSHYYKVCTIQIEGQSGPAAQSFGLVSQGGHAPIYMSANRNLIGHAPSQEFHLVPIAREVVYRKLRGIHVPGYSVRR
jgi:hypothetical protein